MCGRYVRRSEKQAIAEHFHVAASTLPVMAPSFNIAPQTFQPIVRLSRDTAEREIVLMRWGLVPFWSKDAKDGAKRINARAESITTTPAFREAIKRRRCLVPADAFYEWQKLTAKKKQAYAIAMQDDSLYAFAGVWESWREPDGGTLETFAVITTDPNELMGAFHDRMPVIIEPKDYDRWLADSPVEALPLDLWG